MEGKELPSMVAWLGTLQDSRRSKAEDCCGRKMDLGRGSAAVVGVGWIVVGMLRRWIVAGCGWTGSVIWSVEERTRSITDHKISEDMEKGCPS